MAKGWAFPLHMLMTFVSFGAARRFSVFPFPSHFCRGHKWVFPQTGQVSLLSVMDSQLKQKYAKGIVGIAPEALALLAGAAWPGNVRQLHNVVEQCCALTTAPLITAALVQRALRVPALAALSYADAKQRFERNYLVQLLKLTDGNVADAARIAERNRTEFYRLLQKHELAPEMFRGAAERRQ